jgi:aminopeptidase N
VRIKSYAEDKKRQFLIITTRNETLTMGKFYKISMDFVGQLNDKLNGFYRSSYIENGVRK